MRETCPSCRQFRMLCMCRVEAFNVDFATRDKLADGATTVRFQQQHPLRRRQSTPLPPSSSNSSSFRAQRSISEVADDVEKGKDVEVSELGGNLPSEDGDATEKKRSAPNRFVYESPDHKRIVLEAIKGHAQVERKI